MNEISLINGFLLDPSIVEYDLNKILGAQITMLACKSSVRHD